MSKKEKQKWNFKLKNRKLALDIESKKNIRYIIIGGTILLGICLWKVLY